MACCLISDRARGRTGSPGEVVGVDVVDDGEVGVVELDIELEFADCPFAVGTLGI